MQSPTPSDVPIVSENEILPHAFFQQTTGNASIDADLKYIWELDWSNSFIGPVQSWPPELLALINLAMISPQPQLFLLGPESIILYNTPYGRLLRDHHPSYQGKPIAQNKALIQNSTAIDRIVDRATTRTQPANENSVPFFFLNQGQLEEIFLSATMVQLPRALNGYHATTYDTTVEAVRARRDEALRQISSRTTTATNLNTLWSAIIEGLSLADADVPFAVMYCADTEVIKNPATGTVQRSTSATDFHLVGTVGYFSPQPADTICLDSKSSWMRKLNTVAETCKTTRIAESDGLPESFRSSSRGRCHKDDCLEAVVLPCALSSRAGVLCLLVLGLAPRRPYDDEYKSWIDSINLLIAGAISTIVGVETHMFAQENDRIRSMKEREILAKELALKKHEATLATDKIQRMLGIMQSANVGVFESLPSGQLLEMNDSFRRMSYRQKLAHESPTANLFDLCHVDDLDTVKRNWRTLAAGEAGSFSLRFQSPVNQSVRWVQLTCLPVCGDCPSATTIIGCATDISAQKNGEENLKRAEAVEQARIQEARLLRETIEAKKQQESFIDMTSHEIRNPLSVVVHCADALSRSLSDMANELDIVQSTLHDSELQSLRAHVRESSENVDTIMSCTIHQRRITDDILSLSKLNSELLEISPTAFHIEGFMNQVSSTFSAEAKRAHVALETMLDKTLHKLDVTWVEADPGRLMQILVNLVSNAIKFTERRPVERRVTISVGVSATCSTILKGYSSAGDSLPKEILEHAHNTKVYLWFEVNDTGCGMSQGEQSRIFSRFMQASPRTHGTYGGSGLGLFVSRKLANLQDGEIGLRSAEGAGSSFKFYVLASKATPPCLSLPMTNSTKSSVLHPLQPELLSHRKDWPVRILLVEDNLVNQKVLKRQLLRHGFAVHTADNGRLALDLIANTQHRASIGSRQTPCHIFDVILMDIEMPVLNGLQCTKGIRSAELERGLDEHVPIIAVTANARPDQLKQALDAGMDDTISKPFRVEDLVALIEQTLSLGRSP